MSNLSEQVALAKLEERLSSTYSDVPEGRIASALQNARAHFEHSPIRDFVPLLVERRVLAELTNP